MEAEGSSRPLPPGRPDYIIYDVQKSNFLLRFYASENLVYFPFFAKMGSPPQEETMSGHVSCDPGHFGTHRVFCAKEDTGMPDFLRQELRDTDLTASLGRCLIDGIVIFPSDNQHEC